VYNLASGRPQSVRELLETLLGYSEMQIRVERDPARYRVVDVPVVYGSADRFRRQTGWEPQISFERTLCDTLDYWRAQVTEVEGR
jgi:GDP-4-dehydro-6-deoxy-D-mannose reductase